MSARFMSLKESRASGWKFYQEAMKGRDFPIHPHFAAIGFFRIENRHKTESWPLAIWEDQGRKFAQVGDAAVIDLSSPEAEEDFVDKTFRWCCRKPIAYTAYEHWKKHREWPPETGAAAVIKESKAARAATPTIGDNSGADPAVEHEAFVDQVRAALAGVKDLKAVGTDEQAAAANDLRNRLTELAGQGGKLHAAEKKPHLDAGRAVDARWNPVIADARAGAATLRRAIEDHKTTELRKKREAAAARAAAANPVTESPPPDRIEGNYGKRTTVKSILVPVKWDQDAVYEQIKNYKNLQDFIGEIIRKVYAAGGALSGVETEERASVR